MARILITTFGSYGDLHPYIALALGLKQRGHHPVIATSGSYRSKVEAEGLAFHAVRPDLDDFGHFAEVARRVYHPRKGAEYLLRELVLPRFAQTFDDLAVAAQGADLLVTHTLSYAAHLLARSSGARWASTILAPMVFMSVYDPPHLPPAPWLKSLHRVSPALYRAAFRGLKGISRRWSEPIRDFCRSRGLPPPQQDPLFEGQYSPQGTLAMFSPLLAQPQPDWPPHTHTTGFALHDTDEVDLATMSALADFLDAGEAPIVFTLGSSAVYDAGDFFERSVKIARGLKRRAVLLTGRVPENQALPGLPPTVFACEYVPHSRIFPHAAVNVHQGASARSRRPCTPAGRCCWYRSATISRTTRSAPSGSALPVRCRARSSPCLLPSRHSGICSTSRATPPQRPRLRTGSSRRTAWRRPATGWSPCSDNGTTRCRGRSDSRGSDPPTDGSRARDLGLSSARLYKLQMSPIAAPFSVDKLDAIKAACEAAGGTRTNLAYGHAA